MRNMLSVLTGVMVLGWFAPMVSAEISTASLLDEMVDLRRLMRLPEPAYVTKQFSSYEPPSVTHSEHAGWFANWDRGYYLRVEEKNGRKEHVMMDAEGPGAVVRIWSANPEGTLRIYIDGSDKPAIEVDLKALLGGDVAGFPKPIAGERAKGWNLYFPIPYARQCKITCDQGDFYYHVNYRTYAAGTQVKSFSTTDLTQLTDKIQEIAERLSSTRKGGGPPADRVRVPFDVTLEPDRFGTLSDMTGGKAICGFLVHLEADNLEAAARNVVLYMTFDGEQTVETPIGDFFGTATGLNSYASLPLGITADKPQDLWCHWWMPFRENARITVRNLGDQNVRVWGAVATVPHQWDEQSLLFHAKWRIERQVPTRPFSDWVHLAVKGQGRFVGGHLHIINPVPDWWGEGDEKIYVDGETFPSFLGTGTEDYYGYAWCSNEAFIHAYHNQPRCDGPRNFGNTSINRFHIIDDIPFNESFKFDMENWHWHPTCTYTRAAISYWYARPGSYDFFGPISWDHVKLDAVQPSRPRRVRGALEGEEMRVANKTSGETNQQKRPFMSNGCHLLWEKAGPGDKLTVEFNVEQAAEKHAWVCFTGAADYGQVQLYVNGEKTGPMIDLFYKAQVDPHNVKRMRQMEEVDLGSVLLRQGANTLTIEIVGANEKADKQYKVGLDYLLLTK